MPIELTWLIPNRIVLMTWTGYITNDDLRILIDELEVVFGHADGRLHAVIDLYDVEQVDSDIALMFVNHPAFCDPRRGQVALVRVSPRLAHIVTEANQLAREPFLHVFETRSEAQAFLLALDPRQDDL